MCALPNVTWVALSCVSAFTLYMYTCRVSCMSCIELIQVPQLTWNNQKYWQRWAAWVALLLTMLNFSVHKLQQFCCKNVKACNFCRQHFWYFHDALFYRCLYLTIPKIVIGSESTQNVQLASIFWNLNYIFLQKSPASRNTLPHYPPTSPWECVIICRDNAETAIFSTC